MKLEVAAAFEHEDGLGEVRVVEDAVPTRLPHRRIDLSKMNARIPNHAIAATPEAMAL